MKILLCYEKLTDDTNKALNSFFNKIKGIEVKYFQINDVYSIFDFDLIQKQNKVIKDLIEKVDIVVWEGSCGNELLLPIYDNTRNKKPLFVIEKTQNKSVFSKTQNKGWFSYSVKYEQSKIEEALKFIIENGITFIQKKLIFIISGDIGNYLNWCKSKNKLPKSELVRNALSDMIKGDGDYQNYLKKNG